MSIISACFLHELFSSHVQASYCTRYGPLDDPDLARNAGVEPDLAERPELERGIDAPVRAPSRVLITAAAFGVIRSDEFTAEKVVMRQLIRRVTSRAP